jgi:hypothetical protein
MQNPVAIPKGGMMIFLAETAVRDSLTRQTITAIAPAIELISDTTLRGILMNEIFQPCEISQGANFAPGIPPQTIRASIILWHLEVSAAVPILPCHITKYLLSNIIVLQPLA